MQWRKFILSLFFYDCKFDSPLQLKMRQTLFLILKFLYFFNFFQLVTLNQKYEPITELEQLRKEIGSFKS